MRHVLLAKSVVAVVFVDVADHVDNDVIKLSELA